MLELEVSSVGDNGLGFGGDVILGLGRPGLAEFSEDLEAGEGGEEVAYDRHRISLLLESLVNCAFVVSTDLDIFIDVS